MSKHTPGPWHIDDASYGQIVCSRTSDVAVVRNTGGLPHHGNARLIAAAPELLEALKAVLLIADRKHDAFDAARAAITKAEGRS